MFEPPTSERLPTASLIVVALISIASVACATLLGARPLDPHEAAGVFPPWWSREASLVAATEAGAVLAVGTLPFIVIVRTPAPDAPARLRAAGALFSIHPEGVAPCAV